MIYCTLSQSHVRCIKAIRKTGYTGDLEITASQEKQTVEFKAETTGFLYRVTLNCLVSQSGEVRCNLAELIKAVGNAQSVEIKSTENGCVSLNRQEGSRGKRDHLLKPVEYEKYWAIGISEGSANEIPIPQSVLKRAINYCLITACHEEEKSFNGIYMRSRFGGMEFSSINGHDACMYYVPEQECGKTIELTQMTLPTSTAILLEKWLKVGELSEFHQVQVRVQVRGTTSLHAGIRACGKLFSNNPEQESGVPVEIGKFEAIQLLSTLKFPDLHSLIPNFLYNSLEVDRKKLEEVIKPIEKKERANACLQLDQFDCKTKTCRYRIGSGYKELAQGNLQLISCNQEREVPLQWEISSLEAFLQVYQSSTIPVKWHPPKDYSESLLRVKEKLGEGLHHNWEYISTSRYR